MTHLPSWAVPGRKVVCVDAKQCPRFPHALVGGNVYVIRSVPHPLGIKLCGVRHENPSGFSVWRFRPVVTLEDDMLTFRSLLNTVPTTLTLETTQ